MEGESLTNTSIKTKFLQISSKNDPLYDIYIKLLREKLESYSKENTLVVIDSKKKIYEDIDLMDLEKAKDPNNLIKLAKKWKCPLDIDIALFFQLVKKEQTKKPIYNVKSWEYLFFCAQSEITPMLKLFIPNIDTVAKVRKVDEKTKKEKNYTNVYEKCDKFGFVCTTLTTYDTVGLWTNCIRILLGFKPINLKYSNWEIDIYGDRLVEIFNKLNPFISANKSKFAMLINEYMEKIEEMPYHEDIIDEKIEQFQKQSTKFWRNNVAFITQRIFISVQKSRNELYRNKSIIIKNVRIHKSARIEKEQYLQREKEREENERKKKLEEQKRIELEKQREEIRNRPNTNNKTRNNSNNNSNNNNNNNIWRRGANVENRNKSYNSRNYDKSSKFKSSNSTWRKS